MTLKQLLYAILGEISFLLLHKMIVFLCTGPPVANLIALLSMLCKFFRSVFGAD